jgi:glycosyltransferase involved in cell wall biosynthesis
MRILSVSDFYPPVVGGMERHVQSLAHELVRRGHDVAAASLKTDESPSEEVDGGVRVYRISGLSRLLKPFYQSSERQFHPTVPDPGVMAALHRVMKRESPDVVHVRGWIAYSALALKSVSDAAYVMTLHDYGLVCPKRTYVHQEETCSGPGFRKCVTCAAQPMGAAKSLALTSGLRVSSPLHGAVDRYIAVSRPVAEASGGRLGTRRQRVDVIPSLVPDRVGTIPETAPRPTFVPQEGEYMMFVGGLGANKGLDVLLEARALMTHRVPLVVIATPPLRNPPDLPADVSLVVGCKHDLVMGAWAHCVLGVVPSTWPEPFGQVAVEAMASGKAVVASDIGGLSDIVSPGETGLLVPPRNPAALAAAIDELLSDDSRRNAMGAAGRIRARRFFASNVAAEVEDVYREVTTNGRQPAN